MSKNKYRLPFNNTWYVEYGGLTKKTSHSWDIISQRYAYDFEIRKNDKLITYLRETPKRGVEYINKKSM